MKTKRVLRYYCDHCGKGRCHKSSAIHHESRCVKNPNRECGFCKLSELTNRPMSELLAALGNGLDALKKASGNCPACILAAIVQSKTMPARADKDGEEWIKFDYKKAVEEYWDERQQEHEREWEY